MSEQHQSTSRGARVSLDVGGVTVSTELMPEEPIEHMLDRLVLALRQHGIDAKRVGRTIVGYGETRLA